MVHIFSSVFSHLPSFHHHCNTLLIYIVRLLTFPELVRTNICYRDTRFRYQSISRRRRSLHVRFGPIRNISVILSDSAACLRIPQYASAAAWRLLVSALIRYSRAATATRAKKSRNPMTLILF